MRDNDDIGLFGHDDDDYQIEGAQTAQPTDMEVVWKAASLADPLVCPECTTTFILPRDYDWDDKCCVCHECGLRGKPRDSKDGLFLPAKGGITYKEMVEATGRDYGHVGPRRRNLGHNIGKDGGINNRSHSARDRWVVESGFARDGNSHREIYVAFRKWYLARRHRRLR